MEENTFQPPPKAYEAILADTRKIGFQGWCWPPVGALLRVMAASKAGGRMLEIGTGTGIGTCWLLDGMDEEARLILLKKSKMVARQKCRSAIGWTPLPSPSYLTISLST
jgi:predicted O-methyltransferase YrrM